MKRNIAVIATIFFGVAVYGTAGDTAKKLVGIWQLTKEKGRPVTGKSIFELTEDGKYFINETSEGAEVKNEGKYVVKGDTFTITVKAGKKSVSMTAKVKKLTETELHVVLELPDKTTTGLIEYKRVKK
jgi:uncharacterized protein (TIGR03066 family)